MSPSWKTFAALALSLSAFAAEEAGPSLTLDATRGAARAKPEKAPPASNNAASLKAYTSPFSLSTEFAPSISFVNLSTLNTVVGGKHSTIYGFAGSFAGMGLRQSFGYGESVRLHLNGAYSRALSGTGNGLYSAPSARGRIFDVTGELALSLAADDNRRVCFEPFAGYALLDIYLKMQPGLGPEREPWDHLRYYGPMAGLGLSLQPIETFRLGTRLGYIRSYLWDKRQATTLDRGGNRLHTLISSLRLDYAVSQSITTHGSLDYQTWSAAQRDESSCITPYLRRVIVGFGVRVAY